MTTTVTSPSETAAPADRARRARRWRIRPADVVGPLIVFGLFLGAWWWVSESLPDRRSFLVPSPVDMWRQGFANATRRSEIIDAAWQTIRESATGLFLAFLIGVGLAIAMSQARWIERSIFPWAVALQTIPILALVPFIKVRYGVEFKARVVTCVLIAVFPIITNTLFGLQSADEDRHHLFTLHRAGRLRRLWKLQLPGALPAMFTGLRISAGLSVVGAIVGEYFFRSGETGLGHLIEKYRARPSDYPSLYATIVVTCTLGVLIFVAFSVLASLTTRHWYEPAGSGRE